MAALLLELSIVFGILGRQWILVGIALVPGCVVVVSNQPDPYMIATEQNAVVNLRTINTAESVYKSSLGMYGALENLIAAKLLDDTFTGTKAGYKFTITLDATSSHYTAEAVPGSPKWARYGYNSVPDAVVRYSTNASLAPRKQAGKPVQ